MANRWRIVPGPGQESVWDYPRPPRIERVVSSLCVEDGGQEIARGAGGRRVLKTSQPPVHYLPLDTVAAGMLRANARIDVHDAGWSYPAPTPTFTALEDHVAFYAGRLDACSVGAERVAAQAGPFKGAAGIWG